MSLFRDPSYFQTYGRELAELLLVGSVQLGTLAKEKMPITFKNWSKTVLQVAPQPGTNLKEEQLEWLWEALTTEPTIRRELGLQILSRDEEWQTQEAVPVLNKGEALGIFLRPIKTFGDPVLSVPS